MDQMLFGVEAVGPSPLTRVLVAIGIGACLSGAWMVARRLRAAKPRMPMAGDFDADIIGDDLIALQGVPSREPQIVRVFELGLLGLLLGYAFFDRGFAWLHIPGTPLFVGELVLVLGVVAMLSHPSKTLLAVRRSPPLKLLVGFMVWGFGLLALLGVSFGIDAVRDSVLWYYGAVAILTVFLLTSDLHRMRRWKAAFAQIIPWLIGWLFAAVVLDSVLGTGPILVPDSRVSFFSHSAGNSGVVGIMCLAYIWLVDREAPSMTQSTRQALTVACTTLLLFVSLKNRGGFVAGVIGVTLILAFVHRDRFNLVITMIGTAAVIASIALLSQFSVSLFGAREVSVDQFVANVTSIIDPDSGGHRQTSTTQWRVELWQNVLADVNSEFPLTGYGPGPDLGRIYNVTTNPDVPLRNPHNSHVGIIARMGWVGFGIWVIMWAVWALLLLDLRSRLYRMHRFAEAGLVAVPVIGAAMILVNAFFDPSIEGPQVGFLLWFLFGFGASLQLLYHGFATHTGSAVSVVPEKTVAMEGRSFTSD